ncbi:MAG: sigma-70 family RNA polymerase sigma factor [Bryobacterales bacterium]|nr:sigma-70 family RNA polymerase sigma factor [Bryobacterales bacterium]
MNDASAILESNLMDGSVTVLLRRWQSGDSNAEAELFDKVYPELERMAAHIMRREGPAITIEPAALVNEVYLKLTAGQQLDYKDRAHFRCVGARAMHQLLTDRGRARRAAKRGGDFRVVTLSGDAAGASSNIDEIIAVHRALQRLADLNPRQYRIVEMRYFLGATFEEIGDSLGIASRTAKAQWAAARQWLSLELGDKKA